MDLFGGAPVADADRLAWDGVICFGGPGRVVSSMKTKTHFAFRIDISDDTGNSIVGCGIGMRCGALPKIIARRYKECGPPSIFEERDVPRPILHRIALAHDRLQLRSVPEGAMLIDRSAAIVSVLMVTLALTAIKDASAFDVPQRSLGVHGPFEVNLATVAAGGFLKIGTTPGDSPPDTWAGVGLHPSATGSGSRTGEPPGSQSPQPTKIFVASSELGGVDPGIAVGNSFVLVSDQHRIGVYNKVGSLIGPKAGQSAFPNPFKAASLFSAVFDDIAPKLNCPSGLPTANGITAMGDVRVLFDPYRKRFWIYAMAKNNYCFPGGDTIDAKAIADNKLIKL